MQLFHSIESQFYIRANTALIDEETVVPKDELKPSGLITTMIQSAPLQNIISFVCR